MTSKKNMFTNRTPRRIHRNKGGRKKGSTSNKSNNTKQLGLLANMKPKLPTWFP